MTRLGHFMICAVALAMAVPTQAAVFVSSNRQTFLSQRPGITTNGFTGPAVYNDLPNPYTQAGVRFSSTQRLQVIKPIFSDGYLDTNDARPVTLNVSFAGPVLGLELGTLISGNLQYNVNGQIGTVALSNMPTFLGFDLGNPGTLNLSLTLLTSTVPVYDLQVYSFNTAVPEPASWAIMMSGLAVVGGTLRRRRRVSVRFA